MVSVLKWALLAGLMSAPFFLLHGYEGALLLKGNMSWLYFLLAVSGAVWVWPRLRNPDKKPLKPPVHMASSKPRWILAVCPWIFVALFPLFADRAMMDIGIQVLIFVTMAWGLNIAVGYAGLLDLGYIGFYAIGAYTYALCNTELFLGFWSALPLAIGAAGIFAFLIGFPILRLRGDYMAIVTLGFAEIIRMTVLNAEEWFGGPNGIAEIARPTLFGFGEDVLTRPYVLYTIMACFCLIVFLLCRRLRVLPLGRAWEAMREDDIAARALGVDLRSIKLSAYMMAAMIAGMCGAFFAAKQAFISPESFTFLDTAFVLAMVVLGGMGNLAGIAIAAVLIVVLPELFRDFSDYRMLVFGLVMVAVMVLRPGGLVAGRQPSVIYQKRAS